MQHQPGELGFGHQWHLWQSNRGKVFPNQGQQGAMTFKQLKWRLFLRLAALLSASFSIASNTFAQAPGTELWHFNAPGPVSSPAIGPDGTIYFTAAGNLCAVDAS